MAASPIITSTAAPINTGCKELGWAAGGGGQLYSQPDYDKDAQWGAIQEPCAHNGVTNRCLFSRESVFWRGEKKVSGKQQSLCLLPCVCKMYAELHPSTLFQLFLLSFFPFSFKKHHQWIGDMHSLESSFHPYLKINWMVCSRVSIVQQAWSQNWALLFHKTVSHMHRWPISLPLYIFLIRFML